MVTNEVPSDISTEPEDQNSHLHLKHRRLLDESAIANDFLAARGYRSVSDRSDLKALGFADFQCRVPGLLVPIHGVTGTIVTHQFRPDDPRLHEGEKAIKYETPKGSRMALDIPPASFPMLKNTSVPLGITEGARKADSGMTHGPGVCWIDVLGVWNWRGTNADGTKGPLTDWDEIALDGRDVYIVFDSDVVTKPDVQRALRAFAEFLCGRGAVVKVICLPSEGDAKVGLDDFFASGKTATDLWALAKPVDEALIELTTENTYPRRTSQASRLVQLASASVAPFHTPSGEACADIVVNGHRETHPIRSKPFKNWLQKGMYDADRIVPGSQALEDALRTLEAKATYDGPALDVFTRIARDADGTVYLDLADENWRAVKITVDGWDIVDCPPVRFRRPSSLAPIPAPQQGGSINRLRPYVNAGVGIEGDIQFRLIAHFLIAALSPGPYPVLILGGEQGSSKSTTARVIRALIDPATAPLRAAPRDERDLMIAATNAGMPAYDNLSHVPAWLSDALCRLSTGGGLGTRTLYSDAEETIFDAMRPVILTGIDDLATRGDLLDRSITRHLPQIDPSKRQTEAAFWANKGLSNALRRVVPNLRANGIGVDFRREGKQGHRIIVIERLSRGPGDDMNEDRTNRQQRQPESASTVGAEADRQRDRRYRQPTVSRNGVDANSISAMADRADETDDAMPSFSTNALGVSRERVFHLARQREFQKTVIRGGLIVGPGLEAWKTWIQDAECGLLKQAEAVLESRIRERA